ncbi:uncharacterized protein LOC141632547 [Silene latifolia]|uniref:uncharacterized protein LOC141632547 n=1 Tax=Silene latifolia TaxID=37657 RepID=UPI003D775CE7
MSLTPPPSPTQILLNGMDNLQKAMERERIIPPGLGYLTPDSWLLAGSAQMVPEPWGAVARKQYPESATASRQPQCRLRQPNELAILDLREMISRVLGMPPPLQKPGPDSYADSPFVDAISVVAMPKGFNNPNMTLFVGTTDPLDHVSQYKQKMMTVTAIGHAKEAGMCKRFGSTLSGSALRWLVSLPNRSISTFTDLVNAFTQQFARSQKPQKHAGDLYRIVQGVNEIIGEFNTIFNNEKVAVRDFEAVQEKSAAAIRLEEDMLARASIPSMPSVSSTSAIEKSGRKQPTGKKEERYKPYGRGVNRIDIREENQQVPTLAEYGFTIGIGGILKPLRGNGRWTKRHATKTKDDIPETFCRVSHIDLPADAFDEEDVHDNQEHHDALIKTLSMANCRVRKVLVDTGSSVNLIKLKTIENMGFSEKDLQKKTIPLVGFSGETANSLGEIMIPTYAGGINKQVRYLVIDGPSTYNVIFGKPWLHLLKGVPSTYHQYVKFPTPSGVEKIRGDQEEARGCYKKALKCTASPPA